MPLDLPTEAQEALTFVAWLRVHGLRLHHSPNETGRSPEARRRAVRVKREGTSAGFPDYVVLIPPTRSVNGRGFCLFIEMKRQKRGVVSENQQAWLDALNGLDEHAVAGYIARGAQEAIDLVSKHLKPGRSSSPF